MNNILNIFYGILFNPVETMKSFSYEKWYKMPAFLMLLASLFLLILTNTNYDLGTLFLFFSKTTNLLIYWIFFAFFVDLLAKIFQSQSHFEKLLSLTSLAYIPWIFLAPLKLLKSTNFSSLAVILILGVWLWTVILQILAISETYDISRKKAIIVMFIPFIASILYWVWSVDFFVKIFQISQL